MNVNLAFLIKPNSLSKKENLFSFTVFYQYKKGHFNISYTHIYVCFTIAYSMNDHNEKNNVP